MRMYRELLTVKTHREQLAGAELARHRRIVEQRTDELAQARQRLEAYRDYRVRREHELFEVMRDQLVHRSDLDDLKVQSGELRKAEVDLEEAILTAAKALEQAREQLEAARGRYAQAARAKEKFVQFSEIQQTLEQREAARREDLEMEEVAPARALFSTGDEIDEDHGYD